MKALASRRVDHRQVSTSLVGHIALSISRAHNIMCLKQSMIISSCFTIIPIRWLQWAKAPVKTTWATHNARVDVATGRDKCPFWKGKIGQVAKVWSGLVAKSVAVASPHFSSCHCCSIYGTHWKCNCPFDENLVFGTVPLKRSWLKMIISHILPSEQRMYFVGKLLGRLKVSDFSYIWIQFNAHLPSCVRSQFEDTNSKSLITYTQISMLASWIQHIICHFYPLH